MLWLFAHYETVDTRFFLFNFLTWKIKIKKRKKQFMLKKLNNKTFWWSKEKSDLFFLMNSTHWTELELPSLLSNQFNSTDNYILNNKISLEIFLYLVWSQVSMTRLIVLRLNNITVNVFSLGQIFQCSQKQTIILCGYGS